MPSAARVETTDLSNTIAPTSTVLNLGEVMQARIGTTTDKDVLAVDLVAGQTYSFAVVSIGRDWMPDPFLRLMSAGGTELASNDDGLANYNSIITFTATFTGRYYLEASELQGRVGNYAISAAVGTKADFNLDMIAGVIDTGRSWAVSRGTGATVTYDFRASTTGGEPGFTAFTAAQQAATRAILNHISEIANLSFIEANTLQNSNSATILFGNYSANDGAGAYAFYPGSDAWSSVDGDVWFNTANPAALDSKMGSYFWSTIIHEMGHALGLSHPGLYNAAPGVAITYAADAQFIQDNTVFTGMSYFDSSETGGSNVSADTLLLADILALQTKYGANLTTRTGDTVYGFGSTAGATYDFRTNIDPKIAIWDAGGIDTLNVSQSAWRQVVDLTEGSFSNVLGYDMNLAIARGAVIEHAMGGRNADEMIGNAAANRLLGGHGADTLTGGAGNDTLEGGTGADLIRGGEGDDRLVGGRGSMTDPVPAAFDLVRTVYAEGDKLRAPTVSLFPTGSFTLEFLWQQNGLTGEHFSINFGNLRLYRYDDGDFLLQFGGATTESSLYGPFSHIANDGSPHRLSISHDAATGRVVTFVDGAINNVYDLPPNSRGLSSTGGVVLDDNASVGDIRLYNRALSYDTIWAKAWQPVANPATETGLVHYWVADGSGSLVNRMGGPALQGTGTAADRATFAAASETDTMAGGLGNDIYTIGSTNDVIQEDAGGGTDLVQSAVNYSLQAGVAVENLTSYSTTGIRLRGNELAQTLTSGTGIDTLEGGGGNDTYRVNSAQDVVVEVTGGGADTVVSTVSYTLAAAAAVEALTSGSATGIRLVGNALAQTLTSGAGLDTLEGGGGNDIYRVNAAGDVVVETAGGGSDTVVATVSYTLATGVEVEALTAGSASAIRLVGNAFAQTLTSGTGLDTLEGGGGNDIYRVNAAGDVVVEAAGGGSDTVISTVSYTLAAGAEVEGLASGSATSLRLVGNAFGQTLTSGAGFDTLQGGGGNDTYRVNATQDIILEAAGGGTDTVISTVSYRLGAGVEVERMVAQSSFGVSLSGNEIANQLTGSAFGDTLIGGAGNDTLSGAGGDDRLFGGAGQDSMLGGLGSDTFHFTAATDSGTGSLRDVIVDFVSGTDWIDLGSIDASTTLAGDQAFAFATGAAAFSVWTVTDATSLILRADLTGDLVADFEVLLSGARSLLSSDLYL